jgi:hypothetical protein
VVQYFYKAALSDATGDWIHPDSSISSLACVTYLPPLTGTSAGGGTALYTHKATGCYKFDRGNESFAETYRIDSGDERMWECTVYFTERPGWTVVYPTAMFHARHPRFGYGVGMDKCRIVYVAFLKELGA